MTVFYIEVTNFVLFALFFVFHRRVGLTDIDKIAPLEEGALPYNLAEVQRQVKHPATTAAATTTLTKKGGEVTCRSTTSTIPSPVLFCFLPSLFPGDSPYTMTTVLHY